MRAGLSTIQQTLTPEAAGVLNLSIAEAARRNHGQTTPLHVAATLLAAPSGFLRQACIKSHPNSSHPLQCRALELCFSVALERLPTSQTSSSPAALEPPISNALMAALKRAQAHQRRGCPEQQQQPLLAVKVELEQLIISILDDPSVSRVMREASFSSPAVKATIEQTLNSNPTAAVPNPAAVTLGFRPSLSPAPRNIYLNPRLQQSAAATTTTTTSVAGAHSTQQRAEEVKKIFEILSRPRKKNPVLVGESEPEAVVRELMNRIEDSESNLKNVKVISLEREFGPDKATMLSRVTDLDNLVDSMIGTSGLILDFGDLTWLVEQPAGSVPPQQVVSEAARTAVAEVGKLLRRFGDGSSNPNQRLWLIGTATCETYLRCQVYHPTMETDWDLQAVPIAARSPMFPRLGTTGILNNSAESMSHLRNLAPTASSPMRRLSENPNPCSLCPVCKQSYEQELAKLVASESEKPTTPLPAWLQNAKVHPVEEEQLQKKDLQNKWNETCRRAHPQFHRPILGPERMINPTPFSMTGLCSSGPKPNLLLRPGLEPKSFNPKSPLLQKGTLQLKPSPVLAKPTSPPASPVRTELALGREPEKPVNEGVRDFLSCIPSDKMFSKSDTDSFKKLLKGLTDAAWWQKDAASAVASIVSRSKPESRSDRWILFGGPDRVGKKKMVHALSDYVCGSPPIVISFGPVRANDQRVRGKTPVDRIAEGIRRDPFSVIMLEDVDEADMLVRGSIKKAMERGRILDSHGREINLGSVTFVLAANWSPDHVKATRKESSFDEEKLANSLRAGWQLRFSISEKTTKRRANWLQGGSLAVKPRTDIGLLGFDLNETMDDQNDGSRNSSDLTTEHELDLENKVSSNSAVYRDLLCKASDSVIFKPFDFESMQEEISGSISKKLIAFIGDHRVSIDVDDEALERILGGVWLSGIGLEEWIDRTLGPSFDKLRTRLISNPSTDHDGSVLVRLECGGYSDTRAHVEWLPGRVEVAVDGL